MIAVMDFNHWDVPGLPAHKLGEYMCAYDLRRIGTWEPHPEKFELRYIELRKFIKTKEELQSRLDKWLYLLRNLSRLQEPIFPDDPVFRKVFQITELSNLRKEDRQMFIDHERDFRNKAKVWKREGMEKGLKKGEKRIKEREFAIVRSLLKGTDFDDQKIASLVAVEESFVRKIRLNLF